MPIKQLYKTPDFWSLGYNNQMIYLGQTSKIKYWESIKHHDIYIDYYEIDPGRILVYDIIIYVGVHISPEYPNGHIYCCDYANTYNNSTFALCFGARSVFIGNEILNESPLQKFIYKRPHIYYNHSLKIFLDDPSIQHTMQIYDNWENFVFGEPLP